MSKHSEIKSESLIVLSPLVAIVALFVLLSIYPFSEGPNINASFGNPLGFLVSNFVYDGQINVENIALSCAFLLIIFQFYPRFLKIRSALLLPAFALIAGAITEFVAEIACHGSCSFYGMSGISGGIIGFTIANFLLVMIGTFLARREKATAVAQKKLKDRLPLFTLPALFVIYIMLLLLISGFFAIHQGNGNPFPISVQVPDSISGESQPVQIGHTSGIAVGFVLYLAMFLSLSKGSRRHAS